MEDFMKPWRQQILSIFRVVVGLCILQYGTAKILKFPGVPMFAKVETGQWPLWYAGMLELVLGALVVIGLFTRPAAFILSGLMAFAYFMGHAGNNFYPILNGGTAAILFCFAFLYLSAAGAGPLSVDAIVRDKE